MKRAIIIEIILLFNMCLSAFFAVKFIQGIILYHPELGWSLAYYITWTTLYLLSFTSLLAVFITIAIKSFPVFKPLVDKHNARKQKRAEARAERAEADKQAKIEELERQLEELKKDE